MPFDEIDHSRVRLACSETPTLQPDALASRTVQPSTPNGQGAFGLEATASADRPAPPTYVDDVQVSARMVRSNPGMSSTDATSDFRRQGKGLSSRACDCGSCGICWAYLATPLLKFKAKDLMMMPELLALALQADGWYIRSSIIWHKPNPMPESCRDRPTSAHEHVFLLTKSARYFYDADAVREDAEYGRREGTSWKAAMEGSVADKRRPKATTTRGADPASGRNLRNVWTIATAPYSEAHFATYPPALAERCIKAGTSERGCCSQCGKPWVRVMDTARTKDPTRHTGRAAVGCGDRMDADWPRMLTTSTTLGWRAGCDHDAPVVPCTVLDPFAGAGTTLLCADRLQRDAIGIELNTAYTKMAMARCQDDAPLFADVPPAIDPADARIADMFAEPTS